MRKAEENVFGDECMYTVPETFYFPTWKVIERWVHAEQNLESAYGLWTVGERRAQNEWWTHSERYVNARWTIYLECLKSLHVCIYQPKYDINWLNDKWTPNVRWVQYDRSVNALCTGTERSGSERTVSAQWEQRVRFVRALWMHGKMRK